MVVPEAAVHENGRPMARQDDIWTAWQLLDMNPEPEPTLMKQRT
jgi:hypothetical protein